MNILSSSFLQFLKSPTGEKLKDKTSNLTLVDGGEEANNSILYFYFQPVVLRTSKSCFEIYYEALQKQKNKCKRTLNFENNNVSEFVETIRSDDYFALFVFLLRFLSLYKNEPRLVKIV